MEKLNNSLAAFTALLGVAAICSTSVYVYGFGIGYGANFLQFFNLSDLTSLSIKWIVPTVLMSASVVMIALPLGRFGWIVELSIVLLVVYWLIQSLINPTPATQRSTTPNILTLVRYAVMLALFIGAYVVAKKKGDSWKIKLTFIAGALLVVFVGTAGMSAGYYAAHPLVSKDSITLEGHEKPIEGNLIMVLNERSMFRAANDGRLIIIPTASSKLIEINAQ